MPSSSSCPTRRGRCMARRCRSTVWADDRGADDRLPCEKAPVGVFPAVGWLGAWPREDWMSRILGRYADAIYALLRFVAGFMFMFHGLQKLFGAFGGQVMQTGTLPWFAGVIELVCGILIMIGLLASWAAFLASGMMAVAYFMVHQKMGTW